VITVDEIMDSLWTLTQLPDLHLANESEA